MHNDRATARTSAVIHGFFINREGFLDVTERSSGQSPTRGVWAHTYSNGGVSPCLVGTGHLIIVISVTDSRGGHFTGRSPYRRCCSSSRRSPPSASRSSSPGAPGRPPRRRGRDLPSRPVI